MGNLGIWESLFIVIIINSLILLIIDRIGIVDRFMIGKKSKSIPKAGEYWRLNDDKKNPWRIQFAPVYIYNVCDNIVKYDICTISTMDVDLFRRIYHPVIEDRY